MSKENKELSSEETKKVEGGLVFDSTYYYKCLNESCKNKFSSNSSNMKKCPSCGSTKIKKL